MRGTKEKPLTMHFLLKALSAHTGLTSVKRIHFDSIEQARKQGVRYSQIIVRKGTRKKKLKTLKYLKGGVPVLMYSSNKHFPINTRFDEIYVDVLRPMKEYPLQPTVVGKHRDYDKGGWYSDVPLYRFKGTYYAEIECSSYMNSVYLQESKLLSL